MNRHIIYAIVLAASSISFSPTTLDELIDPTIGRTTGIVDSVLKSRRIVTRLVLLEVVCGLCRQCVYTSGVIILGSKPLGVHDKKLPPPPIVITTPLQKLGRSKQTGNGENPVMGVY
jgi:hypothetical protein